MIQFIHRFIEYRYIFLPVLFIILGGVLGGFIFATGLLVFSLMFSKKNGLEILFTITILTFFLGDNLIGPLKFANNFRFIVLGLGILYLLKYKLLQNNHAHYLFPFTIISFVITLLFSPLGIMALSRSLAFWLIALVIFKMVTILHTKNVKRISELLMLTFAIYIGVNLLFVFFPFLDVYILGRFKGLTGNPNGLALISMFIYAIIGLLNVRKETTFKNSFFIVFKVFLLLLVFLTGSRTALFSIIIFEIITRFLHKKVLLIISFFLFAFLYAIFQFFSLNELIYSIGLADYLRMDSLSNASGRTDVWPIAWVEVQNSPWFGNGILYDDYFMKDYVMRNFGDQYSRQWAGVWSSYLSLLLDVGVIGVLVYVYFWVKIVIKANDKKLALAFVSMCLFSAITESWMAASMNPFTPMMFLFWALQTQPINVIQNKRSL